MNYLEELKEIKNKLKNLLFNKTNLAQITGIQKFEYNVGEAQFEINKPITILNEDGTTSNVPSGEYELEDGRKIQVDTDSIIVMITGENTPEEKINDNQMEDENVDKKEITSEMIVGITEAIADLTSRIEKLEGGEVEAVKEEDKVDETKDETELARIRREEEVKEEVEEEVKEEVKEEVEEEVKEEVEEEVKEEVKEEVELSATEKELIELKAELAELKKPADEAVIGEDANTEKENASSYALAEMSKIAKRREELGFGKY